MGALQRGILAIAILAGFVSGCSDQPSNTSTTEIDAKVQRAVQSCIACHGARGISALTQYPNLAGQKQAYLFAQMQKYVSGERPNPVMQSILKAYDEKTLEGLAAYYSSLSPCPDP